MGEAFDDGGFTHSGFADEDGIIFGAAAEDLYDALDFIFTADDRIELIFTRELSEIATEGFEGGGFDVFARGA